MEVSGQQQKKNRCKVWKFWGKKSEKGLSQLSLCIVKNVEEWQACIAQVAIVLTIEYNPLCVITLLCV